MASVFVENCMFERLQSWNVVERWDLGRWLGTNVNLRVDILTKRPSIGRFTAMENSKNKSVFSL